jgi:hypothetical protein
MSCVLRISAPGIEGALGALTLRPYRVEGGTAHFDVSRAGFRDLAAQIEDAIAFLQRHKDDVARLMDLPSAQGWLDFGIADRNHPAQSNVFPAELVCLAGKAGIGLEMSMYWVEDANHTVQ